MPVSTSKCLDLNNYIGIQIIHIQRNTLKIILKIIFNSNIVYSLLCFWMEIPITNDSEAQTPGDTIFKYYHLINHEAIKYTAVQS